MTRVFKALWAPHPGNSATRRGVGAAVRSTTHRSVLVGSQKRNRNPTVGAMLLCWRKPLAKPPLTCVNMIPA
jgi:hypothetical protein